MTDEDLIAAARAAALKAYAPYSQFCVGCAIESVDGKIVTGVNVENACYRLGVCAEQSALSAATQAFGLHNVARIAVTGGNVQAGVLFGEEPSLPAVAVVRRSSKRLNSATATSRSFARQATVGRSSGTISRPSSRMVSGQPI